MTEPFNAAAYFTERRVAAGDADRVALRHPGGSPHLRTSSPTTSAGWRADSPRSGYARRSGCCCAWPTTSSWPPAILATMYLGAVAVPCSTMLTGGELGKLVVDSRARVLLGSHQFAPR